MVSFKFIPTSDWHIRANHPINRSIEFTEQQFTKIEHICKIAKENDAYILCGGDVFDKAIIPYRIIRRYMDLFNSYGVKLVTVYGQHDLRYHAYSTHENTPLSVFIAGINGIHVDETPYENDIVCIQGASWERLYPTPKPDKINILLTHRLVTEGQGLWPGHDDFYKADEVIDESGYDIVVSGDNHQSFVMEKNGRFLFNSGSLMRLSIAQYDYMPRLPIVTATKSRIVYEWFDLPVSPSDEAFIETNETSVTGEVALSKIQSFIDTLHNTQIKPIDFIMNLRIASSKISPEVANIVNTIIERSSK